MTKDAKSPAAFKVRPDAFLPDTADDAEMYAEFVASVPTVDREGEVIRPEEFECQFWLENPVWLWAHDKKQLPIGAGYRTNGSVACDQNKERLVLGCRFSQVNPQGTLLYGLYKEKTIKMVSVGYVGYEERRISGAAYGESGFVLDILHPELVECSCVPVGMNRSAMLQSIKGKAWDGYVDRVGLAGVLDRGHLHGEKVPTDFARELAPFAAKKSFASGHWATKVLAGGNKIPKFSSRPFPGRLALRQSFGGPFMSKAAAPLTAGVVPGKSDPVETKAVTDAKPDPVVETKAADVAEAEAKAKAKAVAEVGTKADGDKQPAAEATMPPGVANIKAAMGGLADWCKSMSEAALMSDHPDMAEYGKALCAKVAGAVGMAYDGGMKMFPDFASEFEEPARVAAEYAALDEEPDAAQVNTDEEADLQADEKDAESTEQDGDEKPEDADRKAVGDLVTKAAFDAWHGKAFGERTPAEMVEDLLRPFADRIGALETQVAAHDESLADAKTILETVL